MDMPTKGYGSRYYSPPIRRGEIFELSEVEIGYEFVLRLVTLRMTLDEARPSKKEQRQERFKRDKNTIARQMGYDIYMSLPSGAKGFESRCAAVKKLVPKLDYSQIAREEKAINEAAVNELYRSIRQMLADHTNQGERRRLLILRMCRYNKL